MLLRAFSRPSQVLSVKMLPWSRLDDRWLWEMMAAGVWRVDLTGLEFAGSTMGVSQ